ncbi:hypothetical protein D3C84_631700 [compost metagenome]
MRRHLPLGVDPAGRMAAQLHHRFKRAIGRYRYHRESAARVFSHRVVADEQMARITAQARMRRLVAQGLHLVDQAKGMSLGIDGETAHAPDRIGLARAVFINHEQALLVLGQGQPGRVFALDHLQWLGVDLSGGTVEGQAINALALAGRVGTHEQLIVVGGGHLDAHCTDAASDQQRPEVTHPVDHRRRCHR